MQLIMILNQKEQHRMSKGPFITYLNKTSFSVVWSIPFFLSDFIAYLKYFDKLKYWNIILMNSFGDFCFYPVK